MKTKKASHVGIVLSFVVFVTFLLFVFTTLSPLAQTNEKKETLMKYAEKAIIEYVSSGMIRVSVSKDLEQSDSDEDIAKIDLTKDYGYANILAKDRDGNLLESRIEGKNVYFKKPSQEVVSLFLTNRNLNEKPLEGSLGNYENWKITFFQEKTHIFEENCLLLLKEYEENYLELKEKLEIPLGSEFGFEFENSTRGIFSSFEREVKKEVYAETLPIQYVDENADILNGFLRIKVW
jgi:hypothetical protein